MAKIPTPPAPPGSAARAAGRDDLLKELSLDLAQIALDIAGLVDPTPISDGAGAVLSAARGDWWGAALSGVSLIPYVGDLAKAGKFPRYLKTVEKAINVARSSPEAARYLNPVMQRIQKALDLLPDMGSTELQRLRQLVSDYAREMRVVKLAASLPDISKQFRFRRFRANGYEYHEASGRLGVPGKVMEHRSGSSQRAVSSGTGDDAGHLIGNRFGAPGGTENLGLQNWIANRYGSFKVLENYWETKLKSGTGIEVMVRDIYKEGATRPFKRKVEWTETAPNGTVTRHEAIFANTHTPQSRDLQDIPPTVLDPPADNLILVDFQNKTVIGTR